MCLLLVASGSVRAWQEHRFQQGLKLGRSDQVPLQSVPLELGPWKGVEAELDPEIVRITAADKVVTRRYTNRNTGVTVDVVLLCGPSFAVSLHSPTVCYPSAGYHVAEDQHERAIEVPAAGTSPAGPNTKPAAAESVPFLSAVYAKGEGAQADLQEVYWSWWYDGAWTPYPANKKRLDRVPSIIKVHTARRALKGERGDADNPSEALLRLLLPELERLLPSRSSPTS